MTQCSSNTFPGKGTYNHSSREMHIMVPAGFFMGCSDAGL